ncbi:MAG TPA: SGNH/GDSL hydrolase family protein [Thermoanaerobaculia bacterium]|nr:SGNH/GDSL hydrolase family protein [Thermoanaerobaculia bacterium]
METRPTQPLSARKKLAFSLVLVGLLWLLVELACWAGLWALEKYKGVEYTPALVQTLSSKHRGILQAHIGGSSSYVVFDPELGWTIRPNGAKRGYRTNRHGIRASREYALQPSPGTLRVAAFGDSFTHASDVPNGETWHRRLEEMHPKLEALNFGVPGFEPGQALLRYRREGVKFHPHVVLIGFMSENINRVVNTFRPFYFPKSGVPFTKPRFALRGSELVVVENPIRSLDGYRELLREPEKVLPRIGENDFFYRRNSKRNPLDFLPSVRLAGIFSSQYLHQPTIRGGVYNTRSEAYQVTQRVLEEFYKEAGKNGTLPILVLFPERRDIRARREGRTVVYQPLLDELRSKGYRVIDLLEGFERYDPQGEMMKKKFIHYPKSGNRMVARHILDYLEKNGLTSPEGVRAAR